MERIFFLTGRPGVGKTSVLMGVIESLKKRGYRVGGMVSSEIRLHGIRVGFEITDILSGKKGTLAHVDQPEGPQVSKYRVNLHDLTEIGARAINNAIEEADLVVIDEVGPMELHSPFFKEAVRRAIRSGKPVLGTVHYKARDPLIDEVKFHPDVEMVEVTLENRNSLAEGVLGKIQSALMG